AGDLPRQAVQQVGVTPGNLGGQFTGTGAVAALRHILLDRHQNRRVHRTALLVSHLLEQRVQLVRQVYRGDHTTIVAFPYGLCQGPGDAVEDVVFAGDDG